MALPRDAVQALADAAAPSADVAKMAELSGTTWGTISGIGSVIAAHPVATAVAVGVGAVALVAYLFGSAKTQISQVDYHGSMGPTRAASVASAAS